MDKSYDKSQFQVPDYTTYTEQDARAELAALQYTPERARPLEPFRFMVDIEAAMLSIRDTRKIIELRRERRVKLFGISSPFRLPAPTPARVEETLTNEEWEVGGGAFGKGRGYRFGLGPRDEHYEKTGMLGWYHVTPNPSNPKNPTKIHFDITPKTVTMLLEDGSPYAPTVQDIERLVHAAYYSLQQVRELSPVDAMLDELIKEIEIPDDISELVQDAGISVIDSRDGYDLAA